MQTRSSSIAILLAVGLLAGCASKVTAPVRDGSGVVAPAAPVGGVPAQPQGLHTVRQGETLLAIARQYGVTLPELVSWNGITDPNQLRVGQTLLVAPPGTVTAAVTPVPSPTTGAIATPVPPSGADAGVVPLKQEPVGGRVTIAEPVVPPPAPTVAPPAGPAVSGQWRWPANGAILAGFNEATNKGVDIAGRVGDPVHAAASGKVVYAGSGLRGYGKLIVIKHNQEYNSVYAHNDKLLVKEDDEVVQGQKIAELGSSEADRPKLHFEIRKQGKAVDPMGYLPAR
ncbi:peptidoglycan DD-metalloendopeptidase family protein [Thauera mechernichensis]|uniref:Peptidoglycan DD-metalloendopeptidase family protein n=1 Tax=Thauera mechernichensis TaxID=82788 RepID=A0ABW3WEP3_9RHOO|nr:peptidoglycan DD-metalloendopeptidase family protein [Thauera mechernichensis]MDG3063898.1 peptidoglycan DD-metalloendopeptidase family protein [Thauera mechernichensis]